MDCTFFSSVNPHIQEKCDLSTIKDSLTILYEDNVPCILQIKGDYIKDDITNYIYLFKCFYTHELQKSGDIDIKKI